MSRFSQLMQQGQQKVNYKQRQGRLLMTMSDDHYKAIATLIQHWLDNSPAPAAPTPARNKRYRQSK